MARLRRWCWWPLMGLVVVGCQGKPAKSTTDETPKSEPVATQTETPAEPVKEVPAGLRHAGFDYYGLGGDKAPTLEVKSSGSVKTGGQKFTLENATDTTATYIQEWTGDLSQNGSTRLQVTDKGVFGIEAQGNKIDPPQLEMPADPKAGFAWTSKAKIELGGGSIDSTDSKIIGVKKIKLGGKDIEVLVVERVSKAKLPDPTGKVVDQTLKSVEHYQKGVGAVRVEVTVSGKGVPTNTFTMEAKL